MDDPIPISATLTRRSKTGVVFSSQVTIDAEGQLLQQTRVSNSVAGGTDEVRKATAKIGPEEVVGILSLAELIVFWNYKDSYPRDGGTATYEITLHLGKKAKTVRVDDLEQVAGANAELFALLELWQRIHRHAVKS